MKLIVDTLGFENEIIEAIKACRRIKKEYSDVEFILVGDEEKIKTLIKENEFQIIDAKQAVIMGENPILSLRNQETSMYKSFNALKEGVGDGLISAGSTASFVVIANSVIKKIEGVEKSGFMCFTPTIIQNKNVAFLDVGANLNCSGENLYQFAKMASIYKSDIENITKPKVGVINIGTEKHKGYQYHNDADTMLENDKTINYTGFIEPREILNGTVDIVVCDGYTGNITLKALEGALKSVSRVLKNNFKKAINWLGALFSYKVIKKLVDTFDYKNNAGALVIGLNKVVVKAHGNADEKQFYSSIKLLYNCVKNDVVEKIKSSFNNA